MNKDLPDSITKLCYFDIKDLEKDLEKNLKRTNHSRRIITGSKY